MFFGKFTVKIKTCFNFYWNLPFHFLSILTKQRSCSPLTPPAIHLTSFLVTFLLRNLRTQENFYKVWQLQRYVFHFTNKSRIASRMFVVSFVILHSVLLLKTDMTKKKKERNFWNHSAKKKNPKQNTQCVCDTISLIRKVLVVKSKETKNKILSERCFQFCSEFEWANQDY